MQISRAWDFGIYEMFCVYLSGNNINILKSNHYGKKVKKSAISGEYIIQQLESGTIEVYRIYDNVKGALREASDFVGFSYDSGWTTRQFGNKLIKAYGSNDMANIGDYVVRELASGSIECYRTYDNIKGALREIADKIGFKYDPEWTTRQLGSKLIDKLD